MLSIKGQSRQGCTCATDSAASTTFNKLCLWPTSMHLCWPAGGKLLPGTEPRSQPELLLLRPVSSAMDQPPVPVPDIGSSCSPPLEAWTLSALARCSSGSVSDALGALGAACQGGSRGEYL